MKGRPRKVKSLDGMGDLDESPQAIPEANKAIVIENFKFVVRFSPNLPAINQTFKKGVMITNKGLIREMLAHGSPIEILN